MSTPTPPTPPITRTIAKGTGNFVNEIFTDATGKVVRVQAWTADQLTALQANLAAQQTQQNANITAMLALLT